MPVRLTYIDTHCEGEREYESMTEMPSNSSGCSYHRCHTCRADAGPAYAGLDGAPGSKTRPNGAAKEAVLDQNLASGLFHSSINHPSHGQNNNTEVVGISEVKYYVDSKSVQGCSPRLVTEAPNTPQIPNDFPEALFSSVAIEPFQLLTAGELSQKDGSQYPTLTEPLHSEKPASLGSTYAFDPIAAFISRMTSGEATSSTASQGTADSPPATLLTALQYNDTIQTLPVPPPPSPAGRMCGIPSPRVDRRSSDGFSTFASRSVVSRAMSPFRRKSSGTPTHQHDDECCSSEISNLSVERVDENRICDLLGATTLTEEKSKWRRRISAPFKRLKRKTCICETGYPSSCGLHKKPPQQAWTLPRFCESLDGTLTSQHSNIEDRLPALDLGADLTGQFTQGAHAHLLCQSSDPGIGLARPLSPKDGALAKQGKSEDAISETLGQDLLEGSWHHISLQRTSSIPLPFSPCLRLRGGAGPDRVQDPSGDDTPINPWLWWIAGGRPLVKHSAPITRGFLRDWRIRSAMTDNGVRRVFWQEFLYSLSGGISGNGRAGEVRAGMRMQDSSSPVGDTADDTGPEPAPDDGAPPAGSAEAAADGPAQ